MFCLKSTEVCLKEVRCFQFPKPIHPLGKKFCVFLLHSYTNSWKSVYTLGISGVGKGVGCCPGVGLILHFPSGYGISLINLFTFRKLNQRISACVQGTPRRGNEHIAQGNRRRSERIAELAPAIPSEEEEDEVSALGMMKR